MLFYIGKRVVYGLIAIWLISILSFIIIQLPPGDYVSSYIANLAAQGSSLDQAEAENLRIFYGLDKPWHVQYGKWALRILTGDLGYSFEWEKPVMDVLSSRLLMTILLALFALLFTWVFAIPIGIYSAVRQHSPEDYVFTFVGFLGLAVPDFLLALWLLWVSFSYFGQNVGGLFSLEYLNAPWSLGRLLDLISHLWIACLVVGTAGTASLIRVMRANLLDELQKPYVITARAKGMREWKVVLKYPVRVAINPLISTLGYLLPYLISGSIIVSVVLNLPTEGPLLLKALFNEDLFVSAAIVLILGTMTVIGTFISDILLAIVDPRIRLTR